MRGRGRLGVLGRGQLGVLGQILFEESCTMPYKQLS